MSISANVHMHGKQHSIRAHVLSGDSYTDPTAHYIIKIVGDNLGDRLTIFAEFSQVKHLAQKLNALIVEVEAEQLESASQW